MILSGWSLNNKYQKRYLTLPGLKNAEDKRERRERLKAVVKGKRQTRISQIDTKKTNLTAPATQHVGQEGTPRTKGAEDKKAMKRRNLNDKKPN